MEDEQGRASQEQPGSSPAAGALDPEEIQKQRDEYYDLLLRKTAEFDNYRKRIERDRQGRIDAAAADVMEELLPLVDDLERALAVQADSPAARTYRQGVELIYRSLLEVLRKRGVEAIVAVGARFDPHLHEAVLYEPAEGRPDGEITEEFRRGYRMGDRLLRPSMVKVAKGEQ